MADLCWCWCWCWFGGEAWVYDLERGGGRNAQGMMKCAWSEWLDNRENDIAEIWSRRGEGAKQDRVVSSAQVQFSRAPSGQLGSLISSVWAL